MNISNIPNGQDIPNIPLASTQTRPCDPTEAGTAWPPLDTSVETPNLAGPSIDLEQMIPDRVGWFRAFTRATAQDLQVPIELVIVAAMGIIALAATGSYEVEIKRGYRLSTTLVFLGLVASGIGKTPLLNRLREPLDMWLNAERRRLEAAIRSYRCNRVILTKQKEKLATVIAKYSLCIDPPTQLAALKDKLIEVDTKLAAHHEDLDPLTITADITPHGIARLLAMSPEHRVGIISAEGELLENLLGRFGSSAVEILCKALDNDPIRLDRSRGSPINIAKPLLAGTVLTQPGVGLKLVTNAWAVEKGLAARFLPILPPTTVGDRTLSDGSQSDQDWSWTSAVQVLLERDRPGKIDLHEATIAFSDTPPEIVTLTDEAAQEFNVFWSAWEQRLRPSGDLSAWASWGNKMRGIIAKIALILHLLHRYPTDPISLETMQAAIRWADYLIENLRAIGSYGQQPEFKKAVEWIRSHGQDTINQRDMFDSLRRAGMMTMDDWKPIFARLVDAGYIRVMPQGERGKGRPSVFYEVNPQVLA
jgi:hypothetical protein